MVDPFSTQDFKRLPDVIGWTLFASVRNKVEALLPGEIKGGFELIGWVADFGRIESNAEQFRSVGKGRFQRGHGLVCGEVAHKAQDETARDAQVGATVEGRRDAVDDRPDVNPAFRMGLGVEEDLGPSHPIAGGSFQVGHVRS